MDLRPVSFQRGYDLMRANCQHYVSDLWSFAVSRHHLGPLEISQIAWNSLCLDHVWSFSAPGRTATGYAQPGFLEPLRDLWTSGARRQSERAWHPSERLLCIAHCLALRTPSPKGVVRGRKRSTRVEIHGKWRLFEAGAWRCVLDAALVKLPVVPRQDEEED